MKIPLRKHMWQKIYQRGIFKPRKVISFTCYDGKNGKILFTDDFSYLKFDI